MKENNIAINDTARTWIDEKLKNDNTVIFFTDGTKLIATISIADKIKETSIEAVKQLKDRGIEVYMLTGDNEQTAKAVSEQVGIEHFKANVLPAEKSAFIKEL